MMPFLFYFIKPQLTDIMIDLAKTHLEDVDIKEGNLKFASSDHASWFNAGYPAVFPSENPRDYNPNIHTRKDTVNTKGISWTQAHRFAELGLLYILKFAG